MKPHITIQLTAWCDDCHHWEYLDAQNKLKGLVEMLSKGWTAYNGRYICANCTQKRKQNETKN